MNEETMEYHKIETLFERDEKTHKVFPDKLRNPVYGIFKKWQFTEKVETRCEKKP